MDKIKKRKKALKKHLLLALKIGTGSCLAILIANLLKLDNASSAGTITLLSLLGTKWDTLKLSVCRLVTFAISMVIAWVLYKTIGSTTFTYGAYIFLTVLIAEMLGWRPTISVNVVAGAHLFMTNDFSAHNFFNEFLLVMIGIILAILFNQIHDYRNHRNGMIADMRRTETDLREILKEMADYLTRPSCSTSVWPMINDLEERLQGYIRDAYEYQDNTIESHPVYYIDYFEMRYDQCQVLHSLHSCMTQIRTIPKQARIIADYMLYLREYVKEINNPEEQERRLQGIFEGMKQEELPKSREEFESRALLYHILMDLESFLSYKRIFVEKLDKEQMDRYWWGLKN